MPSVGENRPVQGGAALPSAEQKPLPTPYVTSLVWCRINFCWWIERRGKTISTDSTPNRANQQLWGVFNTLAISPSSKFRLVQARHGHRLERGGQEKARQGNPRDFSHRSSNTIVPSLPFYESALLMSRLYPQTEASNSPAWKEDKSELHKRISWQAQVVCQYLGLVEFLRSVCRLPVISL